jgi:hypothetical protein
MPQQQQAQRGNGAEVQKQNEAQTQQQKKAQSSQSTQAAKIDISLQNLPKTLDEVIEPEEKSMLQELFPGNGSNWGVDAYKMNNTAANAYSIGTKLDLTT